MSVRMKRNKSSYVETHREKETPREGEKKAVMKAGIGSTKMGAD